MKKIKVGHKVVCIDTSFGNPTGIHEGRVYTVSGKDKCPTCGIKFLLLKEVAILDKDCICGRKMFDDSYIASRFERYNPDKIYRINGINYSEESINNMSKSTLISILKKTCE